RRSPPRRRPTSTIWKVTPLGPRSSSCRPRGRSPWPARRRRRTRASLTCRLPKTRSPGLDERRAACEPWSAIPIILALLGALRAALRTRTDPLENLALRQQLVLLCRGSKRPQFRRLDRLLWVCLSTRWARWREALHLVRP